MTLRAIADELHTTTMTIYRRLNRAGINIKELRADETSEITTEGAAIIASLFKNTTTTADNEAIQQVITDVLNSNKTDATSSTDSPAAKIAALTATVEGLKATLAQVENERDRLRSQVDVLTEMLQVEQQQRERLLTAGTAPTQRRWRWPWQR